MNIVQETGFALAAPASVRQVQQDDSVRTVRYLILRLNLFDSRLIVECRRLVRIGVRSSFHASNAKCSVTDLTRTRRVSVSANATFPLFQWRNLRVSSTILSFNVHSCNPLDIISVEASHERTCWYQVEDQCRVLFIYGFAQDGGKRVRVLNHFICPEPVPVLAISLGVLLALLLLGILAILLYRLYTYVQDRREYARFEEEKKKARWSAVIS